MRDLKDAGFEIIYGNPQKLYIFCGSEYGVKLKYLDMIEKHYGNGRVNVHSVDDLLSMFGKHQLIKPEPKLYIARYDSDFIAKFSSKSSEKSINSLINKIKKCKIIGTAVLIYQDEKDTKVLDKYLGEFCINLRNLGSPFIFKHISQDFPDIPESVLHFISSKCVDYNQASIVCSSLSLLNDYTTEYADRLIYSNKSTVDADVKQAVASRDFQTLCSIIDTVNDADKIIYPILSLMLEFDKARTQKYGKSDYQRYLKNWGFYDIYNYFNIAYKVLSDSREHQVVSDKDICIFLATLLLFRSIPSVESVYDAFE